MGEIELNRRGDHLRVCDLMQSHIISGAYGERARDRPLPAIRIKAAAGNPSRGWLTAGRYSVPVALGRGGIKANKREGDGGTPRGTFRPRQLWWRADRYPRPRTVLPVPPLRRGGGCGGGPPAPRARPRSSRSARSGGMTPGARTPPIGATTSRSGSIATRPATG